MSDSVWTTPDLCDAHGHELAIATPGWRHFGGARRFCGAIATVKCYEDNSFVKEALSEPGEGRVLVVDGGASMRCALVGDQLAALGLRNGWSGVVVDGCVRDTAALLALRFGVVARGVHPLRSEKQQTGQRAVVLKCLGLEVRPGQFCYVDEDGVLVAPRQLD